MVSHRIVAQRVDGARLEPVPDMSNKRDSTGNAPGFADRLWNLNSEPGVLFFTAR
jgi:hypothetical protein